MRDEPPGTAALQAGAPLARLEGQIAIGTLRRMPNLRLAIDPQEVTWKPGLLRGLTRLPVAF